MRVLTVGNMYPPHDLRGGYELMWAAVVRELRARGHRAVVLTTDYRAAGEPDPAHEEDVRRALRWYWRDYAFPRLSLRETVALERHNLRVLDLTLEELQPDVVAWFAMGGMSLSLIERVHHRGIPAAGFVHDDWMLYGPRVDRWQAKTRRLRPLAKGLQRISGVPAGLELGAAARWIFVSETCRSRALREVSGIRQSEVLHSGIDSSLFTPLAPQPWRGELLYVGRIDRRKGVETAIRALAELPEARLTLVGRGDSSYLASLNGVARQLGLRDRLSFREVERAALHGLYGAADAVVFPVHWQEPWGLVPLEAMAVGRPVVASGRGGSGEYLRDGENCLTYGPPDDHLALARAVARLRDDQRLREQLRHEGFKTAAQFDEADFARKAAEQIAMVAALGNRDRR